MFLPFGNSFIVDRASFFCRQMNPEGESLARLPGHFRKVVPSKLFPTTPDGRGPCFSHFSGRHAVSFIVVEHHRRRKLRVYHSRSIEAEIDAGYTIYSLTIRLGSRCPRRCYPVNILRRDKRDVHYSLRIEIACNVLPGRLRRECQHCNISLENLDRSVSPLTTRFCAAPAPHQLLRRSCLSENLRSTAFLDVVVRGTTIWPLMHQ